MFKKLIMTMAMMCVAAATVLAQDGSEENPWIWGAGAAPVLAGAGPHFVEIRTGAGGTNPLIIPTGGATVTIVGGTSSNLVDNGDRQININGNPAATINWNAHITSTIMGAGTTTV